MTTVQHPESKTVEQGICEATFDAETRTVTSLSGYDRAIADGQGNLPTLYDQLLGSGAMLTGTVWDALRDLLGSSPNPDWTPTYERVVIGLDGSEIDPDDADAVAAATVEHEVADCPSCGTPVKIVATDE